MPSKIVMSFHENGSVEYTRNATFIPFKGEGNMRRVTDIKKMDNCNRYYIYWMLGPFAGRNQTYGMAISYGVISTSPTDLYLPVLFDSYEEAVAHEIKMLNAMRKDGVKFNGGTS